MPDSPSYRDRTRVRIVAGVLAVLIVLIGGAGFFWGQALPLPALLLAAAFGVSCVVALWYLLVAWALRVGPGAKMPATAADAQPEEGQGVTEAPKAGCNGHLALRPASRPPAA